MPLPLKEKFIYHKPGVFEIFEDGKVSQEIHNRIHEAGKPFFHLSKEGDLIRERFDFEMNNESFWEALDKLVAHIENSKNRAETYTITLNKETGSHFLLSSYGRLH